MNTYIQSGQEGFKGAVVFFEKEIGQLRTGRANPNILEGITVAAYGAQTPINGVANINVADGQSLVLTPWDRGIIKELEKSLVEADLGLGVVNEGDKIRLTVPKMTEENRRDLVKKLNERMEAARVSIRQARDSVKGAIEEAAKAKEIAEDDKFRYFKELDEYTAKQNEAIKALRDKKEGEIMTI